jgi:hypothetical protein
MFSRLTKFLDKPEPVSVPVEKPKPETFILSPDYRVEPENIFADDTPSSSDFMNVVAKAKGLIKD